MMKETLQQIFYLLRLHKPIGIALLLWPTLWALWLAGQGQPDLFIVCIFVLGVVLMRSAGCVINDIADRHFDRHVERTRMRPLAAGKLSVRTAFIVFVILISLSFLLVLQLNLFTILLSVAGIVFAIIYPLLKRVTHLPQLGLGVAFSWGIPMAFAAQLDAIPARAWVLFATAVIWPVIYDTLYAMVDEADDLQIGIKSTAILFGRHIQLIIAFLQIIFLLLLVWVGFLFGLKWIYFFNLALVATLFIYQQQLIKTRDRKRCFNAFLNNNYVGFIVFLGVILGAKL